jgi:hypothetical protein
MYNDQMAKKTNGMYAGNLSTFGKFCKKYDMDGGKAAEPFFDSIMAQIATMSDADFDKYFKYVPVTPKTYRKGSNNTKNIPLNNQNLKIYMGGSGGGVTFKLVRDSQALSELEKSRATLRAYSSGEHIFILGPISNETFKHIQTRVRVLAKNKNSNLFIHLQGENGVVDANGTDISGDIVGMTPHPGMFNNAFNLQGNLYNAIRFRKLMRENALSYTVCMKGNDRAVNLGPFQGKGAPYFLPGIMKMFYSNIVIDYIKGSPNANKGSKNLKITYITQDLYDKDNFVSLDQIVRASSGIPEVHLVGRAFFNRPGFGPANTMGMPFKNGKMLPGFKSLQFPGGHNAAGAQLNNKFLTNAFRYNNKLSTNINDFIVDSWKTCSTGKLQSVLNSKKSTVDFMNQKSNANINHKPIGFHENMFVNVVGFWLYALYNTYIPKARVFNIFSKNNNSFRQGLNSVKGVPKPPNNTPK